jgi:NADPH:quinone reductase-like Zn-dependent oxidoreductase
MNAVYFNTRGGPEALVYGAATMPGAGEGEIVVRVRAAAVTPTELLWMPTWTTRAGKPRPFPIIPGHEFSGEVHALGSGVNDVAVGDAVFGMNDWFGDGAQAEFCVARMSRRSRLRATT